MKQTIIESYLTQQKLEEILKNEDSLVFLEKEFPVPGTRLRFDFLVRFKDSQTTIAVEFNGYQHYTDAKAIHRDAKKHLIAREQGFVLVNIPYFVQMTNESFEHYFGCKPLTDIIQNYPHGFIDNKAVLPANFCEVGVDRFGNELFLLPDPIKNQVWKSLSDKILVNKMEPCTVFPVSLLSEQVLGIWNHLTTKNKEESELQNPSCFEHLMSC